MALNDGITALTQAIGADVKTLTNAIDGKQAAGSYAPALGADDNYVTDAEKAALHSHSNKAALDQVSGTNTGDQDLSGLVQNTDPRLSDARTPLAHNHDDRYYTEAEVNALLAGSPGYRYTGINAQTSSYTPIAVDEGRLVTLSSGSAVTVTLPTDASAAIPVGGSIDFAVIGAGMVTFAGASGVTVNGTPSLVTRAQWSMVTAIKRAANTWLVVGDLAAA